MEENRYRTAGWMAIIMTILFPLGFGIGIVQSIIGAAKFGYNGPHIGPSDGIFIIFTIMFVYVLYMFRRLLNDKYNFHDVDTLITVAIWWNVVAQILGISLKIFLIFLGSIDQMVAIILMASYGVIMLLSGGLIDILLAIFLLRIKDSMTEILRVYTYITLISGILMVTVILSPLSLLMAPVSLVVLAMVFFKEKEQAEFV